MTNAAVWLRVSSSHQEGDNLAPDVASFVAHHGYEVTAQYEVSESAWNDGTGAGEYRRTLRRALGTRTP